MRRVPECCRRISPPLRGLRISIDVSSGGSHESDRRLQAPGRRGLPAQADAVDVPDDDAGALALLAAPPVPPPVPLPKPPIRICRTTLKQGCYTLAFTPAPATIFSTRFRGTLRVEQQANGRMRFSGDLYSYRWFDHIKPPFPVM